LTRSLSVLISTHDRADLLARTLRHLDAARRPSGWSVDVLVVANACTDGTHALLSSRERGDGEPAAPESPPPLPLRWIAEPTPGKSHALNRAIPLLESEWVAFVDDDHRVEEGYLQAIGAAAESYPGADLFCGRILPDWDGSEPAWVHDSGDYRIYPLPVPRYDLGRLPLPSPQEHGIPGGGNLVLRTRLFAQVGPFATDYGPVGHNLAGGEDQQWVRRALEAGARLQYVPDVVQYHYVDPARLRLGYLVRKAYERSASTARLARRTVDHGFVPPYMVRKLARHLLAVVSSFTSQKRRFHLVRAAASLGEIKGHLQARADRPPGA
jgi:GT2 family glycosyltransferase